MLWRFGFWGSPVVLLSPRGEFGRASFAHHSYRKRIYMMLFRALRIDKHVIWHSTAVHESADIRRVWGQSAPVVMRPNDTLIGSLALPPRKKSDRRLRLAFVSRLVAHKGVDIAIDALRLCSSEISLDVYGPEEDPSFVTHCQRLIQELPPNSVVKLCGRLENERVRATLQRYDAFVFPTAGENFGHVIAEALSASCVVLTTSHTPWTDVLRAGGGTVILSTEPTEWAAAIERLASLSAEEMYRMRIAAGRAYEEWAARPKGTHVWELAIHCAVRQSRNLGEVVKRWS
jgi:glycosyltransferase involved in cell wall biosynthesis